MLVSSADLRLTADVFFISIARFWRWVGRKILHGDQTYAKVYNAGLKFRGGGQSKIFRGQKHAKLGPISDDFKLRWRISLEQMKIFRIGQVHD